ncbi:hypothetical protein [Enterobacter sp. JMULE2]|uniref:hypothetical protein n=1 Tax=Enterobacter sp. JMULE2 TaxID=2518340 RepID=UPI0020C9357E|nr:hypothetical protein [Enterobacter sp. JMULE2]
MSNIDKQAVQAVADLKAGYTIGHADVAILNELMRIALASLEAEAVYFVEIEDGQDINAGRIEGGNRPDLSLLPDGINHLYAAPPASVENTGLQRKAAIHDALCEKYNVESLIDFVEWQRNHIAELEAAPPAPVGHGEAEVMPDYPGYVMTQRECFEAGKKAGMAELVTTANKLPPHVYRELVNSLRDTAVKYQGCQQLREQLSRTLQEVIEPAAPQQEVK